MKIRSVWDTPLARAVSKSGEQIRYAVGQSTLGSVLVALGENGVVMISVGESLEELIAELEVRFPLADIAPGHREEKQAVAQVVASIEDPGKGLDLPLDIRGTDFQKRVWRAVRDIPLGQASTYTEIARKIGAPKAMRAVGTACSKCDFAIAVPCHRVLRSDGTFHAGVWSTGRQGILMKREIEAAKKHSRRTKAK